ncbi:MAG: hypothetical protein IJD14_00480 [Christensenellaceae bacterium]|nr:hypothetical protein [Christensenellaceae bacterium]
MAFDLKAKIEEITEKIKSDKELQAQFKTEPIKAVEKLLNVDLPDDMIEKVVAGVKAKMTADKAGDLLGGIKKLF